jgi:hypothetical protein
LPVAAILKLVLVWRMPWKIVNMPGDAAGEV